MRKRADRESRKSNLDSGWIVEGDAREAELATDAHDAPGATDEAILVGDSPDASEALTEPPSQLGAGSLVLLGVLGGVYLLYAWVWLSWAQYYSDVNLQLAAGSGVVGQVAQQVFFWLAPLAPVLWFLAVLFANRGAATWKLALWLLIGAVVLVPLPMFGEIV